MVERLKYLLKFYIVTVALFIGAKIVFMLCNGAGHGVTLSDAGAVVLHGLTLDLSTGLYLLAVPFLMTAACSFVRVPRWMWKSYRLFVAIALSLTFVADTSLYAFWGFKLDSSCLQYLSQPEGITQSVSTGYLLLRLLLLAVLSFAIYRLLPHAPAIKGVPAILAGKVREGLFLLLLVPLFVIGIRGGLGKSTTNVGQVYYSQNQFLNHAAVNPLFNFFYSLTHRMGNLSQYNFMDDNEARRLTADVFTTESRLTDSLLTTSRPQFVVVILMESAGEQFAKAMPALQQLKQEGINFSRCYANSWRTDRGTVSVLSGWPAYPTLSLMKMTNASRRLPSLAHTMAAEGYQTRFLYGGDINFTNMRSYLLSTGWQSLVSSTDYSAAEQATAQWGVRDDITFGTLADSLFQADAQHRRLLFGYSTLSSHEPWDVPTSTLPDPVDNAFCYLDNCLNHFVSTMRQSPLWPRLLIVVTADHGITHGNITPETPLLKNHVPMLWLGGAISEPRTIDAICNQSDLAATLLGQMQLPHADFPLSRDVLSATYTHPTAINNYPNAQWLIDSTGYLLYDFDLHRPIISNKNPEDSLLRLSEAILQVTHQEAKNLDQ